MSKCSTKAQPEALELNHFTATLLEASLAYHQAEHLASSNKALLRELKWDSNHFLKAVGGKRAAEYGFG